MPDRLPLTQHIDTLYPVARVLVGDAAAPRLVEEVFRRAVHVPDDQRPSDTEPWLIHLLLDVRAGKAAPDSPKRDTPDQDGGDQDGDELDGSELNTGETAEDIALGDGDTDLPEAAGGYDVDLSSSDGSVRIDDKANDETREDDADASLESPVTAPTARPDLASSRGFRREVARSVAERALPVALAACSEQERALLTLHASGARPDSTLAPIAQTIAGDVGTALDEAYGELRAALRDVLTGPERMLIDTALPDAALESVLKAYVTNQYHPAPARLRSDVAGIVERSQGKEDSPDAPHSRMAKDDVLSVTLKRVGLTLLIVTVIAGAVYGGMSLLPSAPDPEATDEPMSLVDLSANRISRVQALAQTPNPDTVAARIRAEFGRRLRVPRIQQAGLSGMGVLDLGPANVPAILYADSTVAQSPRPVIKTLVYSYALIDNLEGMADLDPELRRGLETADSVMVRTSGDARLALWRNADDVFVTVATNTNGDASDLGERIEP